MDDITYVKGDATQPFSKGSKIICHICNDIGGWGRGFVMAISSRWKEPEEKYREWHKFGINFNLGSIQLVPVDHDIWIANMIGQRGIRTRGGIAPIRYEAVRSALEEVSFKALSLDASLHMQRIGCGLAGGSWDVIGPIVKETTVDKGLRVFVYDL